MLLKAVIGNWDQIFRIRSRFRFRTQCHSCRPWEEDHLCRHQCHCHYRIDPTRGSWRVRGKGASLPLTDEGEGNVTTFCCWQWQETELDLSRSHQDIGSFDKTTPTTLQHRLAKPRMRYSHYSIIPPTIWHQSFRRWGTVWCDPTRSLWCSFRTTIYVEASWCIWVTTS